ncbi:MAG: hypothetical protein LUI60_04375 [Clostridia bacterium]|nr:hypothetical protein [Clostridia bacterium]
MEKTSKINDIFGKVCCAIMLAAALALTFTVSDYYIFNRMAQYGVLFCLSQWVKRQGLYCCRWRCFYIAGGQPTGQNICCLLP